MGKVGGARPGAGRKPGKVGQAKRDLAAMARTHAEAALKTLADIALQGESEAARVSAANAILDRGYGKPTQPISGDEDEAPVGIALIRRVIVRPKRDPGDTNT
jgi:hypothetical protein